MNFCIPNEQIRLLKPKLKALGGQKLATMSPLELKSFFSETLGEKLAGQVTNSFLRARSSTQANAIKNWAKQILTEREAQDVAKQQDEAQKKLDEAYRRGELLDSLVYEYTEQDVIEQLFGVGITPDEAMEINRLANKVEEASRTKPEEGSFSGYNIEYFRAMKEMNDYIDSRSPEPISKVLAGTVARSAMLSAPKSIFLNIQGNVLEGAVKGLGQMMTNLVQGKKYKAPPKFEKVAEFVNYAQKVYTETGFDVVRAMAFNPKDMILGEHFKGTSPELSKLRWVADKTSKAVMKYGQGYPDILFASSQFAMKAQVESYNLADAKVSADPNSKNLSKEEYDKRVEEEANKLFERATTLTLKERNLEDLEAIGIKQEAVAYALEATFQDKTGWSKFLMGVRNQADKYSGSLMLGTNLAPFVKTPATIAQRSLMSVPEVVFRGSKMIIGKGTPRDTKLFMENLVRVGFGTLAMALVAYFTDDDDFIPDYALADAYDKQRVKSMNGVYNSIRIGGTWVSLDYFGTSALPLQVALVAFKEKSAIKTGGATLNAVFKSPVLSNVLEIYRAYDDITTYNETAIDIAGDSAVTFAQFIASRIPFSALMGDVAGIVDPYQRQTTYASQGVARASKEAFYSKIPFLRETLDRKYDWLGNDMKTQTGMNGALGAIQTLLFGARVKSLPDDVSVAKELSRLSDAGFNQTMKINQNRKRLVASKIALSEDEYKVLLQAVQYALGNAYAETMDSREYKKADDEEKKSLLSKDHGGAVNEALKRLGWYGKVVAQEKKTDFEKEKQKALDKAKK